MDTPAGFTQTEEVNLFTPRDPHVDPVDAPRLSRQAAEILAMLRARGTCTNMELTRITHRFSARLWDLRKAGFSIVTVALRDGSGVVTYRLVESDR